MQKATGRTSNEERICISGLDSDPARLNGAMRKHWAIENNLHWTLDVTLKEDASGKRAGNAAENFNIVLKVVMGLIVKETSVKKNKRMLAAYDYRYRDKVLGIS